MTAGTLSMEVESLLSFDRIIVTGTATINSALVLEFGTYVPAVNNTFQFITATTYAGAVTSVTINHEFRHDYGNL